MTFCALYFLGQAFYTHEPAVRTTLATLAPVLAGIFPFLGSGVFTQDMRLDLPRIRRFIEGRQPGLPQGRRLRFRRQRRRRLGVRRPATDKGKREETDELEEGRTHGV